MRRVIVFDCDGTLVDSGALILASMDQAFRDVGRSPPPVDAVRHIVGLTLIHAVAHLAPDAPPATHVELAEAYKGALQALRASGAHDEALFPGIGQLLDDLAADGRILAIATGKSRRGLDHLVAKHGWSGRFASLQTSDHHPSKPHPAMLLQAIAETGATPGEAVMIGDTSHDMAMARAAGVAGLAVTWGHHPADALREAGADHVVDDVSALRALLLP